MKGLAEKVTGRPFVALGLCFVLFLLMASRSASAAELPPYERDPVLSLTGDCSTSASDPVLDPSCPYPAPPNRPSGPFDRPRALAVDPAGNLYVAGAGRLDIFDDEGKFISETVVPSAVSIAVDSKGNLYLFESDGDVIRYAPSKYEAEEGKIEYGNPPVAVVSGLFVGALAIDTSPLNEDQLIVAQDGEIKRYASAEAGGALIDNSGPIGLNWPYGLAIDSQRRLLYGSYCKDESSECAIKVLDADEPQEQLSEIDGADTPVGEFTAASGRLSITVDEDSGHVMIADLGSKRIYQYALVGDEYGYRSQISLPELQSNTSIQIAISNGERPTDADPCLYPTDPAPAVGAACNRHYLFVPVFKNPGPVLAFHPSDQTPPVIENVFTSSISQTEAGLGATIFPGGMATEYHFEITTQAAFEANEWAGATVIDSGVIPADKLATKVTTFVTGLVTGGTYRFRVVAKNDLGPAGEEGQNEAIFATYDDAPIVESCPNQPLRLGLSALLPDCRAYELVTPADTNGRPPKGIGFPVNDNFPGVQVSPSGDTVSFKIEGGSLPGLTGVGSFEGDPYRATRDSSGWATELAGPAGNEAGVAVPANFSPDQGYSFWTARIEGPLVVNGEETEYLHYPDGHSELIGRGSLGSDPRAQGQAITENGAHVVFLTSTSFPVVAVQLEPDAPPTGTGAVYDRTIDPETGAEETHTVSLLPGDVTPSAGEHAVFRGISQNGEGIAFSIGKKLYLRVGNETTYEIGESIEFAGVAAGGKRIFYVEGNNLKAFDTDEGVIAFSATGDVTPVNVSADGIRAAFVSPTHLGGVNPEGDEAQAGEQNLYLSEEGTISFVATVTDRDVEGEPVPLGGDNHDGLGLWTQAVDNQIGIDPSRFNPDGSALLFQSRAEITGYPAGKVPQIYRYDSGGALQCISCIPTKRPSTGGASLESYTFNTFSPRPFSPFGFIPNLTSDGQRVFFDSTEPLVSTDTDNVTDVYEWVADGVGDCTRPEGCVYLISSGQSARDNYLYGHSTSGDDVFFTTGDRLTGWDSGEGVTSIYDAKVGGGFPDPEVEEVCAADGCRPTVTPAPVLGRPIAGGDGDLRSRKACPKGKRKVKKNGKVRCVKKKQRKQKGGKTNRAGANRRAGK